MPGPMLYVNAQDAFDSLMVCVTHVEILPLSDVVARPGKIAGCPDAKLLEGMREHYPSIEMNSEVVAIPIYRQRYKFVAERLC